MNIHDINPSAHRNSINYAHEKDHDKLDYYVKFYKIIISTQTFINPHIATASITHTQKKINHKNVDHDQIEHDAFSRR